MLNWKNWCRLCANYEGNINTDLFIKLENLPAIPQIIKKYFDIMIEQNDGKPGKICDICTENLLKIKQFTERCVKADLIFTKLAFKFYDYDTALTIRNEMLQKDLIIQNLTNDDVNKDMIKTEEQLNRKKESATMQRNRKRKKPNNNEIEHVNIKHERFDLDPEEIDTIKVSSTVEHPIDDSSEHTIEEEDYEEEEESLDEDHNEPTNEVKVESTKKTVKKKRVRNYDGVFKCEECGQVFIKSYSLYDHIKSKHSVSKFFCSQCPKAFVTNHLLKLHEKVHLPDELKLIFPCNFCNKRFGRAINLKAHLNTVHSEERSFICDECGKAFKTNRTLQEHLLTHTDEKPFQCTECPKKFKSMARLKVHSDVHSDTVYPCQVCGVIFQIRKSLASHMEVHNDKKFKCEICGNDYKRQKTLKRHLASHTGIKHACAFCDKIFSSSTNRKNHQKNVHPVEYATELGNIK